MRKMVETQKRKPGAKSGRAASGCSQMPMISAMTSAGIGATGARKGAAKLAAIAKALARAMPGKSASGLCGVPAETGAAILC